MPEELYGEDKNGELSETYIMKTSFFMLRQEKSKYLFSLCDLELKRG